MGLRLIAAAGVHADEFLGQREAVGLVGDGGGGDMGLG